MTSDQTFQLILGFISSLVSGGVSGLIVGLVVLRSQFGRQLALDDETKLIDILHLLEKIVDDINGAIGLRALEKEVFPERFDEAEADKKIKLAFFTAELQLDSLSSKAEYLRSKKYGLIKSYLLSKLKPAESK